MPRHTDLPLKILFRTRPQDLLALTGDAGARVLSTRVLELQSVRRTVDFVLELRAGRERYLRHLEFQSRHRPEVLTRAFGYSTQLVLQTGLPVATTLVYLYPPAPPGPLAFTLRLRGRELNRWGFEALHLWELPAGLALSQGPGVMALMPLMQGHDLPLLEEAARRIQAEARPSEQPDLLAILRLLSERRYTQAQLARLVTNEVLMESGLWSQAVTQGKALGRVEERLRLSRRLCASVARRHHRGLVKRLLPVIERCTDVRRLEAWIVDPARMLDEALPQRVVHRVPTAHRRATVPKTAKRA